MYIKYHRIVTEKYDGFYSQVKEQCLGIFDESIDCEERDNDKKALKKKIPCKLYNIKLSD